MLFPVRLAKQSPIGMQYRTSDYAWGEFDNYFFEKNLFGDVVAVYNEAGTENMGYSGGGHGYTSYYDSSAYNTYSVRTTQHIPMVHWEDIIRVRQPIVCQIPITIVFREL